MTASKLHNILIWLPLDGIIPYLMSDRMIDRDDLIKLAKLLHIKYNDMTSFCDFTELIKDEYEERQANRITF